MSRFNILFSAVLTLILVACGQGQSPVAYKSVPAPELVANSSMELQNSEDLLELTEEVPGGAELQLALYNEFPKTGAGVVLPVTTLLDSVIKQGVPKQVAIVSFAKFEQFRPRVANQRFMTMIDYTQHSGKRRMYIVNLETGLVDKITVAHGRNSDDNNNGLADKFSNVVNSKKTSLGAYLVSEVYVSKKHKESLRMDGLEDTNSRARDRGIVMHRAPYVALNKSKQGRSWGCPAIPMDWINRAITRLRDGSFLYAYGKGAKVQQDELEMQRLLMDPNFRLIDEAEEAPVAGDADDNILE